MGKLTYNEQDFQKAAIQFDRDLLKIPVVSIKDTTKFMTVRTGVRGTVLVGHEDVDAEFAPYKANRKSDIDLNLVLRPLTTYFGSLNKEFDPNESLQTLLDHKANQSMADALASTPTAREVLALIGKRAGSKLHKAVWGARRNANGTTTMDLFNGFDTLTEEAIAAAEIVTEKGNYIELTEELTEDNAYPIIQSLLSEMDEDLRDQKAYLYTSIKIADLYNKSYKKHNTGIVYNDRYEQQTVEGSNKNLEIVPLSGKKDSKFIHISTKANMLIGVDQESDTEYVKVKEYAPDTLTYMMRMWFGAQFKTVHKSQLFVAKLFVPGQNSEIRDEPAESMNLEDPNQEESVNEE